MCILRGMKILFHCYLLPDQFYVSFSLFLNSFRLIICFYFISPSMLIIHSYTLLYPLSGWLGDCNIYPWNILLLSSFILAIIYSSFVAAFPQLQCQQGCCHYFQELICFDSTFQKFKKGVCCPHCIALNIFNRKRRALWLSAN